MYSGPHIIKSNLGVAIDASSQRGVRSATDTNMLDYSTWIAGNSNATGFSRNGGSAENALISGTGPFGENAVVWETRCDSTSNADGGWNSSYYTADSSKLYRASVWVKRTSSSASGTFYLGTNGGGTCVLKMDGNSQCNPYWECRGVSGYTQNVWYLVVGHVFPHTYTGTSRHTDSGRYTISGGRIGDNNGCNVGADMRMHANTTSLRHRTYHYYSTDNTVRLQFAYPRLEEVNGQEPSIAELLEGETRKYTNLRNRSQKFFLRNKLRATQAGNLTGRAKIKSFVFDGTDDAIKVTESNHSSLQRSFEFIFRVHSVPATYTPIACFTRASGGTETGKRVWIGLQSNKFRMHGWGTTDPASTTSVTDGNYYHCIYAYNQSDKKHYIWVNGVLENNTTNSQAGQTGWTDTSGLFWWLGHDPQASGWTGSAGGYFDGEIAVFKTYSKILSNNEVKQNFRAYRRRFNI